jgi:hypothetical protein
MKNKLHTAPIDRSHLRRIYRGNPSCCWMCGNEVDLKTRNTDEHGTAVHEGCYLARVALAAESMRLMVRQPAIRVRRALSTDTAVRKLRSSTRSCQKGDEPIIRCPYCRVEHEFCPMTERIERWFQCQSCGHNAMPLDPEFKCACSKCATSQSHAFPDWS